MPTNKKPNRLIAEKSPYLLQHAYNPVDWYPWGDEAFKKAKAENKPVFVSIGYSTCHWCHVMESESFEDKQVAELLNEYFISIKVDREERPDIDAIYMNVCQVMAGHGGWPLNVFLTPDQVPFYVGTYFPKESRYGRPGMMDVVSQLADIYHRKPEKVKLTGERIQQAIQPGDAQQEKVGYMVIETCFRQLSKLFDEQYGGFGEAPKFPTPHNLTFLLRYYRHTNNKRALYMVEKTLDGLAAGGIYDHIGFGFARYSTDEEYLVPHFEKMLYDNAMLAIAYTETYQVTGNAKYKRIVEEIFTYVFRDMQDASGAFYSAEDADSEGVEGKFYVWTPDEVNSVLGEEDGKLFCSVYDITKYGNFEGTSIPNLIDQSIESYAKRHDLNYGKLCAKLESARQRLFEYREQRIHPHKDDKILTSWNALLIAALAKASRVFDEARYMLEAERALSFIEERLIIEGRVMVRYRDGEVKQQGFIDEYAYLLWAYIEMYEASLNLAFLKKAKNTAERMIDLFWDEEAGGFFFYGEDSEQLLIRPKEAYDGALPSGNGVAALQLLRLARLSGDSQLEQKVGELMEAFSASIKSYPTAHTYLLQAHLTMNMKMKEVVVLTKEESAFVKSLQHSFYPEVTYLVSGESESLASIAPFTAGYKKMDNRSTYYVCENFACRQPTTDVGQAEQYMNE